MARDIIAYLWNTASESPRNLEIQQKIEWVKEATSGAIMDTFEGEKPITSNIHPTAKIHPSVEIPEGCEIGEGVVIEKGATLNPQVTIWDHSTIEENVLLANQVTIWDHSTIKERCRIFHKTTVWKGSNIWMHSIVDDSVVIEENVTLWNYVKIQGPETIIGKKSVIWDNVSLTWYNDDNLKIMKIWEIALSKVILILLEILTFLILLIKDYDIVVIQKESRRQQNSWRNIKSGLKYSQMLSLMKKENLKDLGL